MIQDRIFGKQAGRQVIQDRTFDRQAGDAGSDIWQAGR